MDIGPPFNKPYTKPVLPWPIWIALKSMLLLRHRLWRVLRELQIDMNTLNIHGGAISLGHPLGGPVLAIQQTLDKAGGYGSYSNS